MRVWEFSQTSAVLQQFNGLRSSLVVMAGILPSFVEVAKPFHSSICWSLN